MGKIVSKVEFAEIIGKSERWVGELIGQGMPAESTGKKGVAVRIDTERAINWMIAREVGKHFGDGEGEDSRAGEELRLIRARASKIEAEDAQLRGELVWVGDVQDVLNEVATLYATQLDSIGSRIVGAIGLTGIEAANAKHAAEAEARRIRAVTAGKLQAYAAGAGGAVGDDRATAAGEDGGPVGRSE